MDALIEEFDQQNKATNTIFVQQTGKWTKLFQTSLRLKHHIYFLGRASVKPEHYTQNKIITVLVCCDHLYYLPKPSEINENFLWNICRVVAGIETFH